jgi:hypothetical protein
MSDLKTSLLINRQVPEFVREEHPKFIAFLEAYYEFLETKQGTQLNDLSAEAKQLRYVSDVDESLDDFEENFFNTYVSLIPRDVAVDREFLIKNVLPVYLSKGSESSFKLLFRLLFGKDATISYPKDNILRASDGKWVIENALKVTNEVSTEYTGDGVTKEFELAQISGTDDISVYIDDALQYSGYYTKRELRKLVFDSAPANNSSILVTFKNFDASLLNNRKVVGASSGASGVVERATKASLGGDIYYEIYINSKNLDGSFLNGEFVTSDIITNIGTTLTLKMETVSEVKSITVTFGGASYNIGDPVIVRGDATESAYAVVNEIETGLIESVDVLNGGAGFKINNIVSAIGFPNTSFDAVVESVDTSGNVTPNSVVVFNDMISAFANVTLNVADYGFPNSTIVSENVNTVISQALSNVSITGLGPITTINVVSTIITSLPTFEVIPTTVNGAITLVDLGIIGKLNILDGGENYVVGDEIIFTNQPNDFWGRDAVAVVTSVDANGSIVGVRVTNGGFGYDPLNFPTVTANTANGGSNASLSIHCVMGDGESLQGVLPVDEEGNQIPAGRIKTIKVIDGGSGYKVLPIVDLTKSGDGLATATAQLLNSYETFPGKWTTSDSIISSEDRKLEGRNYYINYSYVLSSQVEFSKYKEIFKQLIHPSGMVEYAEYDIDKVITSVQPVANTVVVANTISGLVEVTNNSIYVTGTNTKFNVAVSRGILSVGSNIAINNQVKTVNAIISNTVISVTDVFTITTNNESLVIL